VHIAVEQAGDGGRDLCETAVCELSPVHARPSGTLSAINRSIPVVAGSGIPCWFLAQAVAPRGWVSRAGSIQWRRGGQ
jgi:hypothetical protein